MNSKKYENQEDQNMKSADRDSEMRDVEMRDAATFPNDTLSDDTLSDETLSDETLSGETLSGETLSGETLSGEALLTAIALDEALPEERAQFEAERNTGSGRSDGRSDGRSGGRSSEELLEELDAIRKLAQDLTLALAQEPLPDESDKISESETQKGSEKMTKGTESMETQKKNPRKRRWISFSTCTAALLLVLCAGSLLLQKNAMLRETAMLLETANEAYQAMPLEEHGVFTPELKPAAPASVTSAPFEETTEDLTQEMLKGFDEEEIEEFTEEDIEESTEEEIEEFTEEAEEEAAASASEPPTAVIDLPSKAQVKSKRARNMNGMNGMQMRMEKQADAVMDGESRSMPAPEAPEFPAPVRPAPMPVPRPYPTPALPPSAPQYVDIQENEFKNPADAPYSTFGLDTDSASYAQTRTFLTENEMLPPRESVRVEEFVNYFDYALEGPAADDACPLRPHVEVRPHPWREGLLMAMVAVKGREIPEEKRPKLNLVFLIDVSGSMSDWNKMPLVRDGMFQLLDKLRPEDRISIVTYASDTQVRLAPTPGNEKSAIEKVLLELNPYGGTSGGDGLQKAYALARENFDPEAVNRIILCSDGDFNVGITDPEALKSLVEREAKSGVFLTVLGFGMGNFHDDRMKTLAASGNGNYAYVDSRSEAKKVLADDLVGSMIPIAKDVKLQIEFNPARVAAYRLIGYERRKLEDRDFNDDRKDSGEIGAGHCAVALYEIVPVGTEIPSASRLDPPRYGKKTDAETPVTAETQADAETQANAETKPDAESAEPETAQEWFFVKLRWKEPTASASMLRTFPVTFDAEKEKETPPSENFRFVAGTALFALLLRDSPHTGSASLGTVLDLIQPAVGEDPHRTELKSLVEKAQKFMR